MSEIKNQDTLYSLLELLLPKKEEDGTHSNKYKEDIAIIDDVVLRMPKIYKNSAEEEANLIYMILNFRIKELYCDFGEYEKALNFNKPFSDKFISYLEKNEISDYEIPNLIYEATAQLKTNNCIEEQLFSLLDKLFSSELSERITFFIPMYDFNINGRNIYIQLDIEKFLCVYTNYLKETQENCNRIEIEEKLCFIFDKVMGWASEIYTDKVNEELKGLLGMVGLPYNTDKNYFIIFSQLYLDIELLKISHKKYDGEEGEFNSLNKKELKEITSKLNKFICHILSMRKDFVEVNSDFHIRVLDITKHFSLYNEGKNIFIKSFIENLPNYSPIDKVLDLIITENIEILFEYEEYSLIANYYHRHKNEDNYNIKYHAFDMAYSLYNQKYYEESKIVYESIIDNDDAGSSVYNNLSLIYENQGDFYKAQELLNKAIKISKDDKIAKNNLIRIEEKVNQEKKIQKIKDVYSQSPTDVEFENLPFTTKVYLGAICRELLSENLYDIKPKIEAQKPITPTDKLLKMVYNDLSSNQAITVSSRSPIEAFSQEKDVEFPQTYYIYKVVYNLNLVLPSKKQELIDQILNPKYYSDEFSEEAYMLWKEIAIEECIEYLLYQLNSVGFKDFKPGEKTNIVINTLLEKFSVGQVYGIIYKSVANASKLYLEKNMPKAQAANSVIGGCQRLGENAILKKWDMSQYSRIKELPQSVLSEFFFNKVIRIGDKGFTMPPMHIESIVINT